MKEMMATRFLALFGAFLLATLFGLTADGVAKEVSLGAPVIRPDAGFTISAAYETPLPIEGTDPAGQPLFLSPEKADLFLTVNIRGEKGNKNGFGAGEFIPYLSVSYTLTRQGTSDVQHGHLYPLVTPNGIRCGNNVKLTGLGAYTLTLMIESPIKVGFGRHTDLETGVSRWWKPFQAEWTFKYAPLPK